MGRRYACARNWHGVQSTPVYRISLGLMVLSPCIVDELRKSDVVAAGQLGYLADEMALLGHSPKFVNRLRAELRRK